VIRHGVVESTNALALEAVAAGTARHGDVHVAAGQTRGRGRRGRAWFSPAGRGLYLSLVWRPDPRRCETTGLSMAAGLGVLDALGSLGARGLRLDWPNDLLAGEAKLCGILIESRGLDPAAPCFVVGIGLNVGALEPPAELAAEREVTSLAAIGVDTSVDGALRAVSAALPRRLAQLEDDPAGLVRDYLAAARLADRDVVVEGPEVHRGRLVELDLQRGLRLERPDGRILELPLGHVRGLQPGE